MLNRWIGILSAAVMILANAAIFVRDILPRYLPDDAPPTDAQLLGPDETRYVQVGIYREDGGTVGHSWTRSHRKAASGIVMILTHTVLERIHLPGGIRTPRVRIETQVTYRQDEARVDELDFKMFGLGVPISLEGGAMPTGEFACRWQAGAERGSFLLDSRAPAALGDVIKPFDRLPSLYVGRTWRLKLVDPLSQILPQLNATGLDLDAVIIRVTGKEAITAGDRQIEAFVVEGGGATAWVAPHGRVLKQTVVLPLLGKLILLDEAYDAEALEAATQSVPHDPQ